MVLQANYLRAHILVIEFLALGVLGNLLGFRFCYGNFVFSNFGLPGIPWIPWLVSPCPGTSVNLLWVVVRRE